MGWLLGKLRSLLRGLAFLVVMVVVVVVLAFVAHALGYIDSPAHYVDVVRHVNWKKLIGGAVAAFVAMFFIIDILDNPGGGYGRGGVRHGDQVTYSDRNRNGIPDDMENRY